MTFIPIPDSAKATLEFTWGGQVVAVTLHWRKAGFTSSDVDDLGQALRSWWNDTAKSNYSQDIALENIQITDLRTSDGEVYDLPISPAAAGTVAQDSVPNNVALAIKLGTPKRGRSFRGRSFIPGLPITAMETSTKVFAAYLGDILGAHTALIAVGASVGWDLVVASRATGGAPRTTGVTTAVEYMSAGVNTDSQRRRLAGRGT